jgi:hypothetical protein
MAVIQRLRASLSSSTHTLIHVFCMHVFRTRSGWRRCIVRTMQGQGCQGHVGGAEEHAAGKDRRRAGQVREAVRGPRRALRCAALRCVRVRACLHACCACVLCVLACVLCVRACEQSASAAPRVCVSVRTWSTASLVTLLCERQPPRLRRPPSLAACLLAADTACAPDCCSPVFVFLRVPTDDRPATNTPPPPPPPPPPTPCHRQRLVSPPPFFPQ